MARRFTPHLRSRGDRAPQVEDGTFEGRTNQTGLPKPDKFTAIVWAPGPSPSIELWCLRTPTAPRAFAPIGEDLADPAAPYSNYMWVDRVDRIEPTDPPEAFAPPVGAGPTDIVTQTALRSYAAARFASHYGEQDSIANWTIDVARPFQAPYEDVHPRKIRTGLYVVLQGDQTPGAPALQVAYVWVPPDAGREIWLHVTPGQPGGFLFVGSVPDGQTERYTDSLLTFVRQPDEMWDFAAYSVAIGKFKDWAVRVPGCPVGSKSELQLTDWRVAFGDNP